MSYVRKKRRTRGSIITMVGMGIALAYVLLKVLLMLLFRIDIREFVGPVTLPPATGVILASVLAGFLTDYFQPAKSSRAALSSQRRSSAVDASFPGA